MSHSLYKANNVLAEIETYTFVPEGNVVQVTLETYEHDRDRSSDVTFNMSLDEARAKYKELTSRGFTKEPQSLDYDLIVY